MHSIVKFLTWIPSDVLLPASNEDCLERVPDSCGDETATVPAALASLNWCCKEKSML